MTDDDDLDDEELLQPFQLPVLLQTKFSKLKTTKISHVWAILHIFMQKVGPKLILHIWRKIRTFWVQSTCLR